MSEKAFPSIRDENEKKVPPKKNELSIAVFGNRFLLDQNLYEYLIEFLLVFCSPKTKDLSKGKFHFHDFDDKDFNYYVAPRLGLKRFIFYNYSKKDKSLPEDKKAYDLLREQLCNKLDNCDDENEKIQIVDAIRDFLYGYAVILKNRNWSAQAILPLCPELIFCEASPNQKERQNNVDWDNNPYTIDTFFQLKQRNFLARGGELYYLHILQALQGHDDKQKELEYLLTHLLTNDTKEISNISKFIQQTWEELIGADKDPKIKEQLNCVTMTLDFIPSNAYISCSSFAIDELINYLSAQLPIVRRIDLLAKGVMYQVMRMLASATAAYLDQKPMPWIIDVLGVQSFRKYAHKCYKLLEESFRTVLTNVAIDKNLSVASKKEEYKKIKLEKDRFGFGILKSKGKELHCIIPAKGADERFTLSEDVVSFLVLSLIPPSQQITFDDFLDRLYEHFNIIIGSKQFTNSIFYTNELGNSLSKYFEQNELQFEKLLNNTGFLIELSDATSVVINPYKNIKDEE